MSVKEENGGNCGEDDDEWRDLIATPNRLISDEFFTLKAEKSRDREDDEAIEEQEQVSTVCSDRNSGIAERRADMRGSDANASRISVSDSSSRISAWSPFISTPDGNHGISPSLLFDSSIMLPNSQASPTTGSFQYPSLNQETLGMKSELEDMSCDSSSLTYQPDWASLLWPCFSEVQNQNPGALMEETVAKKSPTELDSSQGFKIPKNMIKSEKGAVQLCHTNDKDDTKRHIVDVYPKETSLSTMKNSEDGYNWRKYGQKQVKGSEYPRSYYKCTHPSCPVKKKVERSHDGHITEIIYKGNHNHQGNRNVTGSPDAIKLEEKGAWGNSNNIGIRPEWTSDHIDRSSSTSVVTDKSSDLKSVGTFGSAANRELSSSNPNYDYHEEDENTIGTHSPGDDGDDDKSELKRRRKGNYILETSMVTKAMREPRVVVQIESEVDILDDGYRWRKYGQKVVKGNPNPRSYYKCTSTGCPVRKHVERVSDDLKSVLTTYEGKHNHEVPAARNSTHATIDAAGSTSNTPPLPLSRIPKPEPQIKDLPLRFDPKFTNRYTPSNFVSNLETKPTKFEASPIYQTEYIPYQNTIFSGSVLPDFPISFPPSGNMVYNGFGYNNNNNNINNGKRGREFSIAQGQHLGENNGRHLRPKLEQVDGFYDTFMSAPDHVNGVTSKFCPGDSKFSFIR